MEQVPSTSAGTASKATLLCKSIEENMKIKLTVFEERVIHLAEVMSPKPIPDKILQNDMPDVKAEERVVAINRLVSLGILDLYTQGNTPLYKLKYKGEGEGDSLKNADKEELVVFEIIKEASNKGIWIKDIRFKSNLNQTQLNKILKSLEGKKMIKPIKSVAANRRKVYMLYNLEPDRSVTGGAWYTDQDFESEFVSVLNVQCYRYLSDRLKQAEQLVHKIGPRAARSQALVRVDEVCDFIAKLQISTVQLTKEDIACILDTLIYDGKVERIVKGDIVHYVAVNSFLDTPGLARTPCGVCPVIRDCTPNGIINPKSCQYLTLWLNDSKELSMGSE